MRESQHRDSKLVVGAGELLWDLLPDGENLGGAPANFAYHVAQLGDRSFILSRVGDDEHQVPHGVHSLARWSDAHTTIGSRADGHPRDHTSFLTFSCTRMHR